MSFSCFFIYIQFYTGTFIYLFVCTVILDHTMVSTSHGDLNQPSTSNVYCDDDSFNYDNSDGSREEFSTDNDSEVEISPMWCDKTFRLKLVSFMGVPGTKYNFCTLCPTH